MKELEKANIAADESEASKIVLNTMSKIEGPYAFVFWLVRPLFKTTIDWKNEHHLFLCLIIFNKY